MLTVTITATLMSEVSSGGTPPSNTVAPVISGSSAIGSTLTSTTGTWAGTPVITYAYQWKRAGVNIVGETNSTYVLVVADYNKAITCEVTATNSFGFASALSNSITGTATAPVNTVAPVISGTNVVGSTLSSTTGTWTGSPTPTYTYQWKRGASNIGGATSSTYTLVQADATFAVTCVVTATNPAGIASATSNALTIIDADAQAFFTASGLTGTTNLNAINQLVLDLKSYGIWTKMKAIYPMIGGTAALHKWNLKDPQDTNAAFRLTFAGGWTHSATGALPGGVNGYANTFLNPNSAFSVNNDIHFSYYSRTNISAVDCEIGAQITNYIVLSIRRSDQSNQTFYGLNTTGTFSTFVDPNSAAFYIGSRIGTAQKGFRNSSLVANTTNTAGARPNANVFLATLNVNGNPDAGLYSAKECAFASLGDGLTDTEAANFYTAVQAYNTTLGRQV